MKQQLLKRPLLLALLLMAGMAVWAQIPANYYKNAEGKTGQDLRAALHNIIKGHTVVSYGDLYDYYPYTDCDQNGKIIDIYSDYHYDPNDDKGSVSAEGQGYNREHTWPQSWFGSGTPKTDIFHVYPTDSYVNSRRSNHPYAMVKYTAGKENNYRSSNGSTLGTSITEGYSGVAFEPADEYKGDIARTYFYMSTRYYTEDGSWKSSAMTEKCEIKPWAMKMLLQWHKDDPVSEKEISRNNMIYDMVQHNRNPFIDHPEYANMIWDENWTETPSHNITCATNLGNGSVSAPATAYEGSTVAITATPKPGYLVSSYSAWKTNDTGTPVTVSTNGTFTMPDYDVTVSAAFEQNTTLYDVAIQQPAEGGTIKASTAESFSGQTITLTATPEHGYAVVAWYVWRTGDMNTIVEVQGNEFIMPAFDVTVSASFAAEGSTLAYKKVTVAPADWSGQYLIVYETGSKAFDGSLTTLDANNNNISVSIANETIAYTEATEAAEFTIAPMTGGYSIKSASGNYIGQSSDANGLASSDAPLLNTISYSDGSADIKAAGGTHLRFNKSSGQERFRYFKSSTYTAQQPIQLYKREGEATAAMHTITFHDGDATTTQRVKEFTPTQLDVCTFTNEGYAFNGWNTKENGTGDFYGDGTTVTLLADLDLYAQWDKLYNVTVEQTEGGSIDVSLDEATEGDIVILTAEPDDNYVFYEWNVVNANGEAVTLMGDELDMPASDITVSAIFVFVGNTGESYYELVTSEDELENGNTYLIVNAEAQKAMSTNQKDNNRGATSVTISDNTISSLPADACEFTLGGNVGYWTFYDAGLNGYLYASSSSANQLKTNSSNESNNSKWSISIATGGTATITARGDNTRNVMQYNPNNNNPLFSCYASASQKPVCLFVRKDVACEPLVLANDDSKRSESNAELLAAAAGKKVNAVIYGRTLFKDESWNTLCLPFDVDVEGSLLDGATLKELTSASVSGTTLTMNFTATDKVKAGQPYLVKWANGNDILAPLFEGVTVASDVQPVPTAFSDGSGKFVGVYQPVTLAAGDRTVLYMGNGNNVYYPGRDLTLGAFRAYFQLLDGYHTGTQTLPTRFVLNFDDDADITGISDVQHSTVQSYYDLQGRQVKQPTKGVYMMNGRKLVVK